MSISKSGPTSFGFIRDNGMLRSHPDEAPVRRYIFELFAEHQRKKTVAMILNAEGHRTRSGAEFNGITIGRLLTEEAAKGIKGVAEPLVSIDLWQRCNDILASQKRSGRAARKVAHLFSGLVHCVCGTKMYVPSNTGKYVCTSCRNKIPADDLEAVFADQLGKHFGNEDGMETEKFQKYWLQLSFDSKRDAVELTTERIVVDGKKVTFCLVVI